MKAVILTTIFYACFQIFASLASRRLDSANFLIYATISIVICTVLFSFGAFKELKPVSELDMTGIAYVFIANVFITFFTYYLSRSFQTFDSSLVIPFVFGGAILLSTTTLLAIEKRVPSIQEVSGLLLVVGGLFLVGSKGQ